MAQSYNGYNFNQVVKNSLAYLNKEYTAKAIAEANMEEQEIARAQAAINAEPTLGTLTLGDRLAQAGFGKRVAQQIVDTAVGAVSGIVSPLTEYLNKYEKVFDLENFQKEYNADAFQMYTASQEMAKAAANGVYINGLTNLTPNAKTSTGFVYDM